MARRFVSAAGLAAILLWSALPHAQSNPSCSVSGVISSSGVVLPGVVVSLVSADGRIADVESSADDGSYALNAPLPGGYVLKAELVAFAPVTRDVTLEQSACQHRLDVTMTLASRTARPAVPAQPRSQSVGRTAVPQSFQTLQLLADQAGLSRVDEANAPGATSAAAVLPPGFTPESSADSVTAIGTAPQNDLFFGPNGPGDFAQRFGALGGFDGAGADGFGPGGPGAAFGRGAGGPAGRGGFGPGVGPLFGRGGRGGNQIRGAVFQSFDTSALDAAPYALNGQTSKPDYLQQRFGATLGGPLIIPKIVNDPRTFFFVNYTGNHSRSPYDAYSTVPTVAERAGDLSALGRTVVDPSSGTPFAGNQIPAARLDAAAQRLLALVPLPNQPGATQNFHTVTTVTNQLDDVNLRVVHSFGTAPQRGRQGSPGGFGGRGGGGGGGRGRGGAGSSNLNVAIHYRRADNTTANPFPALGGDTSTSAWDVPANFSFTKGGMLNTLRAGFNRQHSESKSAFAFAQNIAGDAGLLGAATDPFDWGAPSLSFATFASLRDAAPSTRTDQTISVGDTVTKTHNRHTFRFGGDYRSIRTDSRVDANARGTYVFTGLYSGVDFGDFLLGLPQQASVQFGPGVEQFRSASWDLFAQDDWRATDAVTINAGLRYEYFSPVAEADGRLVTLDVPPSFTAAVPVYAGGVGPFSGALPDTIVRPFRTGFAPRVGLAWRFNQRSVLRTGYSINYNSSVYQTIAQQLAAQPKFATTNTVIATAAERIPLETMLLAASPGATLNTYAVDPNYRLPFVQIWNVDLQRDLTRTLQLGVGYTGTKGTDLDLLRAPNRTVTGLRIEDVAPFIFESSTADSVMNSLTVRLRKRLSGGIGAGLGYTLSKSVDDASSIAGAGGTVAQNDQDLGAERGPSTFDQRHRLSADFTIELPFGTDRRWLTSGSAARLLGGWVFNGSLQLASGTPFTARVLSSAIDVARGTNGTLRANYNGEPIASSDPTAQRFFNTDAFSLPAPGTFGNAGRDTIVGPGTSTLNLGLTKNIDVGQNRALSIQVLANNVLNDVQFALIDTVVNSPTFGQVTAVRPMRRLQILTRFRF